MDPLEAQLEEAMRQLVTFTDEQKAGVRQRCRGYTGRERAHCLIININAIVEIRRKQRIEREERTERYEAELARKRQRIKEIREEQAAARGDRARRREKAPPKPERLKPSEQRPDIAARRKKLLDRPTGQRTRPGQAVFSLGPSFGFLTVPVGPRGRTYNDVCVDLARRNAVRRQFHQPIIPAPWFCEDLETAVRSERARERDIESAGSQRRKESRPPALRERTAGEQLEAERLRSGFVYYGAGAPSTRRR